MTEPGLARERTAIAWARTGLGAAGFGIALIRVGVTRGSVIDIAAGVMSLLGSALLSLSGRALRRGTADRHSVGTLRSVTLAVAAIGVLTITAAVLR